MTVYEFADLDDWARKVERVETLSIQQAVNDLLGGIEIAPGINRSGSRRHGTVPRDFGTLAGSLQSKLHGSTSLSATGESSYILVAGGMKPGDTATFSWGGDIAPYAPHVHWGANGVKGTLWIEVAAAKWNGYVSGAVNRARSMVG